MKYLAKKLFTLIITLLLISVLAFLAFQIIPGDPATKLLGTNATAQQLDTLRRQMGLYDPAVVRYFRWLGEFLGGTMGTSYSYSVPVASLLADKLPVTAVLTFFSFGMIVVFSIPMGIFAARKDGTPLGHLLMVIDQLLMAVPAFFLGIVFTLVFGLMLHLFTAGSYVSWQASPVGFLQYLFFPALAIALPRSAQTVRLLRGAIVHQAGQDYVRTAYSRGSSSRAVLYGHVLRNALIPLVTFLGMTFSGIVAGSIIVEQVFSIPGVGRLLLSSISNRDYPVVQAIVVILAGVVVTVNFLVDVLYQFIDPRVKLE